MAIIKCTKYHDCNRLPMNQFPIEKIFHHIWVRSHQDLQSNSNEIKEKNIVNIIDQYQKLQGFRPMFWINDESLHPNTIAQLKNLRASREHPILKIISNKLKFDRPEYCPTASITYEAWVKTVVTENMYKEGEVSEVFSGRNCSIETRYGWNNYIGSDGKEKSWVTDEDQ